MSNRGTLSCWMILALALLFSLPAAAADMPQAPVSEAEFFASLQAPEPVEPGLAPGLEDTVRTEKPPLFKHGYNCTYIGSRDCVPCAIGKRTHCDDYRCYYNGVWHTDSICGACLNVC